MLLRFAPQWKLSAGASNRTAQQWKMHSLPQWQPVRSLRWEEVGVFFTVPAPVRWQHHSWATGRHSALQETAEPKEAVPEAGWEAGTKSHDALQSLSSPNTPAKCHQASNSTCCYEALLVPQNALWPLPALLHKLSIRDQFHHYGKA